MAFRGGVIWGDYSNEDSLVANDTCSQIAAGAEITIQQSTYGHYPVHTRWIRDVGFVPLASQTTRQCTVAERSSSSARGFSEKNRHSQEILPNPMAEQCMLKKPTLSNSVTATSNRTRPVPCRMHGTA